MVSNCPNSTVNKEAKAGLSKEIVSSLTVVLQQAIRLEDHRLKVQIQSASVISRIQRSQIESQCEAVLQTYQILSQLVCLPTLQDW